MGHQIYAGSAELCFSRGAGLVSGWCYDIDPPKKPEGMPDYEWADSQLGSTNIPSESVKKTNAVIPLSYQEAKDRGFCKYYRGEVPEDEFNQCREFLRYAAENNHDIHGSY
jgi:hypothetical protein